MSRTASLSSCLNLRSFLLMGMLVTGAIHSPCLSPPSQAQTPPITPSGLNTQVNLSATPPAGKVQYDITGGTRPGGGLNLFHSFGEFGVSTNNIANFLNETALPTSNILGRVTGGNISNIFGAIQTTGFGNANLFLMNPAGFLFGPNATVNVGGMVAFTSADYLKLTDNARFSAFPNAAADVLLTASPVAAFGFLGSNPGAITVQGSHFTVTEGADISLVGGNITVQSGTLENATVQPAWLTAPSGKINLASVASPGEVLYSSLQTAPNVNGQSFTNMGTITLGQGTILSSAGDSSFGDGSGGSVSIRGGQFVATGAMIVTSPAEGSAGSGGEVTIVGSGTATLTDTSILTNSLFAGGSGSVSVTANDSLAMTNTTIDTSTIIAGGDSGAVTLITGGPLLVTDSQVLTFSDTSGNAGTVSLTGDILLRGTSIQATAFEGGNAGAVTLTGSPDVTLLDGSVIDTTVFGVFGGASTSRSGDVALAAEGTVTIADSFIFANSFETAENGSPVTISGQTVNLSNGLIDTTAQSELVSPAGTSGNIEIHGRDIGLTGFGLTSIINNASPETTGVGGSILFLDAENVSLTASTVNTSSNSLGTGGTIEFNTRMLTMTEGTVVGSEAFGPGSGGTVVVIGAENVSLESGSVVSTTTTSEGPAGNILFETQHLMINDGSKLRSDSFGAGNAGTITVQGNSPAQSVLIDGFGSGILTDTQGSGAGGDISLNAKSVTVQNGGILSATTSGSVPEATGGTITVHADRIGGDGATITVETGGLGNAGTITLMTEDMGLGSDAIALSNSFINSNTLGDGHAGSVSIGTKSLHLENTSILSDSIPGTGILGGNAGDIRLDVRGEAVLLNTQISSTTFTDGNAGTILMTGPRVALDSSTLSTTTMPEPGFSGGHAGSIELGIGSLAMNDALITSQSFSSAGNGGTVTITASESITTSGSGIFPFAVSTSTDGTLPSCPGTCGNGGSISVMAPTIALDGVGLNSTTNGQGNAGNILVKADHLSINNGALISASAEGPVVTGAGGTVTIQGLASPAQSVVIGGTGSGIFTETQGSGAGGNIFVNADSVTLQNGGQVTSSSTGPGNTGNIQINAGNQFAMTNSSVTTEANQSSGGTIKITTTPSGTVQLTDSTISASVLDGTGGGGSVNIDPQYVIMQGSQILAQAVQGPGGNITIAITNGGLFLPDTTSIVSASSQFGVDGTVTIQSPISQAGGKILPLGKSPLQATSLLSQRCAALAGGEFSSFTVAGRDSLPAEPGGWLSSPLAALSAGAGQPFDGSTGSPSRVQSRDGLTVPSRAEGVVRGEGEGLSGLSGLSSSSGLFGAFGPKNEIDQTNQIDQTDQTNEPPVLSLRQIAPPGFLTQAFPVDWSAGCTS